MKAVNNLWEIARRLDWQPSQPCPPHHPAQVAEQAQAAKKPEGVPA